MNQKEIILTQNPPPGRHILLFRGDIAFFELKVKGVSGGRAFLRTNVGNAFIRRREIIEAVETKRQRSGQDWHDVPMEETSEGTFSVSLAMLEVGHFESKSFLLSDDDAEPLWVSGDNFHINVEPAEYCCANSIYCAFVRQFGQNKNNKTSSSTDINADIYRLDNAGFSVIPPSGTFRSLIKELDLIIDKMKCRILHLLPINPTPTVYARMGRYGSPYASLDFSSVDPALADFDRKATPLDQFLELVDAVHRKNAKIFLDIAINHTGWAAKIHEEHPEWLVREPDGSIHSPGAWGTVWGDLTELNHNSLDLWKYVAGIFIIWCGRGVDGFRCDAGYMIPADAWEFIISRVRGEYPDTIFLLEGLGGDPAVTRQLLDKANMNWAYSELFQNYSREQIQSYIPYAQEISASDGIMVHYAETHDNSRLSAVSPAYAQMRTALCALTSSTGAFGFTNGLEWFATEKIDVHEANALNWGNSINQIPHVRRLNSILISHPCFYNNSTVKFIESGSSQVIALVRSERESGRNLLILVNLDCDKNSKVILDRKETLFECKSMLDLITEEYFIPTAISDSQFSLMLAPGQVLCLTPDIKDLKAISEAEEKQVLRPDRIARQRAQAVGLDLMCWKNRSNIAVDMDVKKVSFELLSDPVGFCKNLFPGNVELPLVTWKWPEDLRRRVMIPPGHIIMITAPHRFRARIADENSMIIVQRDSLRDDSGNYFALFVPIPVPKKHRSLKLKISVYKDEHSSRKKSELLLLATEDNSVMKVFANSEIRSSYLTFLDTNRRGGMLRPCLQWGFLNSRYDSIISANLNKDYPEDRHIMWRRCRAWIDYRGRRELFSLDTTDNFSLNNDGSGTWKFHIPVGNGLYVDMSINMSMSNEDNAVTMNIYRNAAANDTDFLSDDVSVKVIIRPDIEDRNFHMETKAINGPEHEWPRAIEHSTRHFLFTPSGDRKLLISSLKGKFIHAPEWQYSIYHEREASRGLEPFSDLFSPGYFEMSLGGGEGEQIIGHVITPWDNKKIPLGPFSKPPELADSSFSSTLLEAMDQFIVQRSGLKTVIAGYPWFLDWGRDTLICARGLIAGGRTDDVAQILLLFAKFEEKGTLPNMIHGADAGNRDTSDAPLWFFVACSDLCRKINGMGFLNTSVEGKGTLLNVLENIVRGYINGTPNGIRMDEESGLIFSPPHFTWMDTNYPAGTPREGYPVEIQALWFFALSFLAEATGKTGWSDLSSKVKKSFHDLFILKNERYLSDCLHSTPGKSALNSQPDDSLRPNQIFAITLGLTDNFEIRRDIVSAVSTLLIPGALRSLADRPVRFQLPIYGKNGYLINDPANPYWGRYEGDEDYRRKPAYHNGTAWTWIFPSYVEAHFLANGESGRRTARAILSTSKILLEDGCVGNIPEILDGDYPHLQRGCDAQAWGVTELYRVWKLLN